MSRKSSVSSASSHGQSKFVSAVEAPVALPQHIYWFLYQGDQLVVVDSEGLIQVVTAAQIAEAGLAPLRVQYLGYLDAEDGPIHCYSGELEETTALPDGFSVVDLRRLFDEWDATLFGLAGRAKQVVHWDRDHQYCSRCGAPTATMQNERAKRCPQCGLTSYPRLSPAIIIAVTRVTEEGEQILLARNHRFPTGRYSVVAGFVEPGETLEQCAEREVYEEVGVHIRNIRYFDSQPWPFPNSLMIGFTAEYAGGDIRLEEAEIADAQWFAADRLPQLPPKISIARRLIDAFVARNENRTRIDADERG